MRNELPSKEEVSTSQVHRTAVLPNFDELDARLRMLGLQPTVGRAQVLRPVYIREDGVGVVILANGRETLVDAEDAPWVAGKSWRMDKDGYAISTVCRCNGKTTTIFLHRLILLPYGDLVSDHVNGDRLDNRRTNLRLATPAENHRNYSLPRHNTSGFKGVDWCKATASWRARIKVNGRKATVGYFHTIEDAALAYDAAATKLHGPFAKTNVALGLLPAENG